MFNGKIRKYHSLQREILWKISNKDLGSTLNKKPGNYSVINCLHYWYWINDIAKSNAKVIGK